MQSTTTAPALLITGPLEAAIHAFLRGLAFAPCYLPDTVAHVEARGTAEGCEWLDRAEADAVNDLVARHTGDVETDPAGWPAWTDAERWEPTPPPISGGSPDEDEPFEPTPQDLAWWEAESAAYDAMAAGMTPADLKPVRVRNRPQCDWTDADQAVHGCV